MYASGLSSPLPHEHDLGVYASGLSSPLPHEHDLGVYASGLSSPLPHPSAVSPAPASLLCRSSSWCSTVRGEEHQYLLLVHATVSKFTVCDRLARH